MTTLIEQGDPVELGSIMTADPSQIEIQPGVPEHVQRIVLTGFMGAGKTSTGRELAKRLGWEFADLDAVIEAGAGLTIAELFERDGEAEFRRMESSALARSLARKKIVLALGGGAVETLTNRLLLEQTPATLNVFLDAPFSILQQRVMRHNGGAVRPVFSDAAAAEKRFQQRLPFYQRIAGIRVETTTMDLKHTVEGLILALRTL
jgi:shikimate kinase